MDINKLCIHCMNEVDVGVGGVCPHCGQIIGREPELNHQLKPMTILRGKYLVGDVLGEGGFGITYIGLDLNLELKVAIKEFYPNGFATRESSSTSILTIYEGQNVDIVYKWRDNFIKEARSLARCAHLSGVVEVRDFFEENNTAYLVMEYVEGVTLKDLARTKGGRIPVYELLPAIEPIFIALGEVHRQGLIHRDISPDNIMLLPGGKMKLLDFGAAREYAADEKSLSVMLKPGYAPEEQYRTKGNQGPWSDIYALAGTIYKCLTGVTPPDAMERMRQDDLQKPNTQGAGMSEGQETALLKAMAVRAEERYQVVEEFRRDLYADKNIPQSAQTTYSAQIAQSAQNMSSTQAIQPAALQAAGEAVPGNKEQPNNPQRKPQTDKMKLLCAVVGAAAVVIIVGIMRTTGNRNSDVVPAAAEEQNHTENNFYLDPNDVSESAEEMDTSEISADGAVLSADEIENEVLRIREVWDADRDAVANGWFEQREPEPGVFTYFDGDDLKMVEIEQGVYNTAYIIFQIEDGELTFAYYEDSDIQDRLYFKDGTLFRWIYTDLGQDPVIHDNDWGNELYSYWEQSAFSTWQMLLASGVAEHSFVEDTAIHHYELIVRDCSWSEAYWDCISRGGYLARINSWEEFEVITNQIRSEGKKSIVFWLGASRSEESDKYFWVDSNGNHILECINTPEYQEYWLKNEPSLTGVNAAGEEEQETYLCMLYRSAEDRFFWNDAPDNISGFYKGKIGYICEYED